MTHPGKLTNPRSFIERACAIMNMAWYIHQNGGEEITVRLSPHASCLGVYETATGRSWSIYGDGLAPLGDSIKDCENHLRELLEQHKHD